MTALTPMLQQYLEIKEQHKDELLFFRLGDFYELFNEDALTASRELNLTLTKRAGGKAGASSSMPMCGVPFHSVDGYLAKLIRKGYKIAICDQMEDPKKAVGIVKRQVTKILTPGTVLSDAVLEESHNQYLVCLEQDQDTLCLSYADVSTGECAWYTARGKDLWFHVQKAPGSHVVVMSRGEEIPDTTKQEAAELAVIYSSTYKAGAGAKVAVDTTEVKNIWKASGAKPGMVLYEVYTTVYITPRDGLAEQLKKK